MSTERDIRIRCNACGYATEPVDSTEMSESELRRDLTKRLGWMSFRTDTPRGRNDVCPDCQKGGN
jgi:hypothetical protein